LANRILVAIETNSKASRLNTVLLTWNRFVAATAEADEVDHPGTRKACEVLDRSAASVRSPMPVDTCNCCLFCMALQWCIGDSSLIGYCCLSLNRKAFHNGDLDSICRYSTRPNTRTKLHHYYYDIACDM